jgi:hypothetical protein
MDSGFAQERARDAQLRIVNDDFGLNSAAQEVAVEAFRQTVALRTSKGVSS